MIRADRLERLIDAETAYIIDPTPETLRAMIEAVRAAYQPEPEPAEASDGP